jgi:5S rRNA maturation endonuclease (ribonuclease M5)
MTAFIRITDALRDHGSTVTETGDSKAKAQCPAHVDAKASLSVGPRRDGKGVVIHCHAGCEPPDVMAALGLTMADLFDEPKMRDAWNPTRNYDYPGGRRVHRKPGKDFPQSGNKADKSLFHADRIGDTEIVYVTEGEKDVEMIEAVGGVAACPPMGAGQRNLDRYDWSVLKAKHVIIIQDKDGPGREHAQQLAVILDPIADSVKITEAAAGKDAADHIVADKGLDEFVEIVNPLLAGLKSAADLDGMAFNPLVEHVPSLIVEGFGILAGSPKVGKSWLAVAIALACAQGGIALNGIRVQPRHVLLLALEDGDRRLQSRMRRLNGDQPLPQRLTYLTKVQPGMVAATITAWLKLHRGDENPPLIILDTLGKARPQRKPGEDPYIADYLLGTWIKNTVDSVPGAALVAVHHTRKTGAEDWLDTLSGTQGIAGSADYVLVLTRERKSDEGLLAVTGRDIVENEYAMRVDNGIWRIDGSDLHVAADRAETRREEGRLGDRALEVMAFVNGRFETRAADVAKELGIAQDQAPVYLSRLASKDRIRKLGRGIYGPVSYVPTVRKSDGDVTEITKQTDGSIRDEGKRPRCKHCGEELLHPDSIARGYCAKPECLLKGDNE